MRRTEYYYSKFAFTFYLEWITNSTKMKTADHKALGGKRHLWYISVCACRVTGLTWPRLTGHGVLLNVRRHSVCIKRRLMDPPVRPLPKQNPAVENRNGYLQKTLPYFDFTKSDSKLHSPFEHQVQPVSNHSHPDELNPHRRPQVEPKWEEDEEGVPEIRCPGHPEKQALGIRIVALEVVGGAHPKTLHGVHDSVKHLRYKWEKSYRSSEV